MPDTCGITVTATNNTNQGAVTFNSFSFISGGGMEPTGFPPVVHTTLADGDTQTILQAIFDQQYEGNQWGVEQPISSACKGTAVFNLPDGSPLTITWDLNSLVAGNTPQITPSLGYALSGNTTPVSSDGSNFVFEIVITSQ